MEQQAQDSFQEVLNMAEEAVVAKLQEQIDVEQDILDATQDATTKLINKIQE
jgi:hypothetical protein